MISLSERENTDVSARREWGAGEEREFRIEYVQ